MRLKTVGYRNFIESMRRLYATASRATVLLLLLVYAVSASAQDYVSQTGSPAFSVAQPVRFGFLNLANGNLHLEMPLASAPQRGGLGLELSLVYDSRIWQVVKTGGSLLWKPTNVPNSLGGWRFVTSADPGAVTFDTLTTSCGGSAFTSNFSNFVWESADGTKRTFPLATAQDLGCGGDVKSADGFATDSSGYHMYVTNYQNAVIYAKNGVQVFPALQDTNGNHFSTDANGNVVDTLGRTVIQKSANGNQIFYDVLNSQGKTSRITVTTRSIQISTFFRHDQSGIADDQEMITVVSSVTLPTGDIYTFNFDESVLTPGSPVGAATTGYGMLQSVAVSGVGTVATYGYTNFIDAFGVVNRWGSSTLDSTVSYSVGNCQPACQIATLTRNGGTIAYSFTLNNGAWNTDINAQIGTAPIAHVTNSYDFAQTCSGCPGPVYVRPTSQRVTLPVPGGGFVTSRTDSAYDSPQSANIVTTKAWNFYSGDSSATSPSSPDRQTTIAYSSDSSLLAKHITNAATTVTLADGAGKQVSQTKFEYDGTKLVSLPGAISNHDDTVDAHRGNLTKISKWTGGSTFLDTLITYDASGQIVQINDPAGNATKFAYTDNFYKDDGSSQLPTANPSQPTNAYLTSVTLPIAGQMQFGYYFGTGKQAFVKDPNGRQTYQHFMDDLDRVTQVVSPKGWQAMAYASLNTVDSYAGITDALPSTSCTGCLHQKTQVDPIQNLVTSSLLSDPDGAVSQGVVSDPVGNPRVATNPQRSSTVDLNKRSTKTSYDVLYRPTQIQHPDNSSALAFYGSDAAGPAAFPALTGAAAQSCATTTYGTGFPVLSVDEVGKKHQVWRDAFGRVIETDEPDINNALTVATCYQYNIGGELTQVVQGSQTRSYQYDPLWRVTQVSTPEAGTEKFSYLNDDGTFCSGEQSAICKRVDGRGIITTYHYDPLGRLTGKTYSDGTPSAFFNYEETTALSVSQLTDTIGRLSSIYTKDAAGKILTGEVFSYDVAGNLINNSQCTPQNCGANVFQNTYTTDQMGNVVAFNNSWGRNLSAVYDKAGQVTSLSVSPSDAAHPATVFANAKYNEFGSLIADSLGNGLEEAFGYSTTTGSLNEARVGSAAPFNQPGPGNVAMPGSTVINISGSVKQATSSAAPGTATLSISGSPRQTSNGTQAGLSSSGTMTISGIEQVKQMVEIPAAAGTGTVAVSGTLQTKQTTVPGTLSTGSFAISGSLQVIQGSQAIAGSGSITFTGTEQSRPGRPAAQATGSVTIAGTESSTTIDPCAGQDPPAIGQPAPSCPRTIWDTGPISITVNGFTKSVGYSAGSDSPSLASGLAAAFNSDSSSPVTASANGSVVNLTSKSAGTAFNYSFSAASSTNDASDFGTASFTASPSGTTLIGGANSSPSIFDSGTCSVSLNGTVYSTAFGQGDTIGTISSRLAAMISSGTLANASASSAAMSLTAKQTGAASNYSLGSSCSYNSSAFSSASFVASPAGAALSGGTNAGPTYADSGTATVTIGSFVASVPYLPSDPNGSITLASNLAAKLNTQSGSPVTAVASGSTLNLTYRMAGNAGNISFACTSATGQPNTFTGPSFTCPSTNTLSGGKDAVTNTTYDSGTVSIKVGNFTASAPYGQIWAYQDLTALAGGQPANVLTSFVLPDPNAPDRVVYVSWNQHVHEMASNANGGWRDQDMTALLGAPTADGSLTSFAWPNSTSTEHLFYAHGGDIHEMWLDPGGAWHDQDNTALAGAPKTEFTSALTSFLSADPNAPEHVFYLDSNQDVHEMWLGPGGVWHDQDNTSSSGGPRLPGADVLTSFASPNSTVPEHLFYLDGNAHIHEQWSSSGIWHDQDNMVLSGAAAAVSGSALTSFLWPNSSSPSHVFYLGANQHVHEQALTGGAWHDQDITSLSGGPAAVAGSALSSFLSPSPISPEHVFYLDSNQHAHELSLNSGTWHDQDVTVASGAPIASVGSQLTSFVDAFGEHLLYISNQHITHLYFGNTTAGLMALALVNDPKTGLNVAASPVQATVSGTSISLTAKNNGLLSNYGLTSSSTFDSADFAAPSLTGAVSGPALAGGTDGVSTPLYDSGTLSVTVNNHTDLVDWGQGATAQGLAAELATAINLDAGAPASARASGNMITFTSKALGANTTYAYVPQITSDTNDFSQASFMVQPLVLPPATLQGGRDPVNGQVWDTGTITVTVNGFSEIVSYGQSDTIASLTGALAAAFNADANSPVWACQCTPLKFTARKAGGNSNYTISATSASNNSNFSGSSFPVSLSSPTLIGGVDSGSTQAAISDSGTASLSVGSFKASVEYGQNTNASPAPLCCTASDVAAALGNIINQSSNSPVIAAVVGPQISLTAKSGGAASNYSFSASSISNDPVHFPAGSFGFNAASGSMTGGADKPNPAAGSSSFATIAFGGGGPLQVQDGQPCAYYYLLLTVGSQTYNTCLGSSSPVSPATFAASVAQSVNQVLSTGPSNVTATVSGSTVFLQSTSAGAKTNYPISFTFILRWTDPPPINVTSSGPSMAGGSDNGGLVYTLDLGTDPAGTIFTANDSVNGSWTYFYDDLNRLQEASTPAIGYTYDYDRYGNRLHQTPMNGGSGSALVYLNNQVVGPQIQYDASGNMISDGTHTYAYDAENRLISVDAGQTATYVYNADGIRVRSTVGTTSFDFIHDADGNMVGVLGPGGTLIRQEIGQLATYSDAAYFHHRDWLGNLRVVTDQTGAVKQTCTNLPFGDGLNCTSAGVTPSYFTGYQRDAQTNLDFANARYFSSQFARFMGPDPVAGNVADPQSLNRYAYVSNNPLSMVDPSGMVSCPPGLNLCVWSPGANGGGSVGVGALGGPFGGGGSVFGAGGSGLGICFSLNCGFGGGFASAMPGPPSAGQLASASRGYDISVGIGKEAFNQLRGLLAQSAPGGGWAFDKLGVPEFQASNSTQKWTMRGVFAASLFIPGEGEGALGAKIGNKLEYLFGKSLGANAVRSKAMLRELQRIGIGDTPAMRAYLESHLQQVFADATNVVSRIGARATRESLLMGPFGGIKLQTIWEHNKLITFLLFGGR